jgi:hypothetical protein
MTSAVLNLTVASPKYATKKPVSLNAAASEIVFQFVFNIDKFCFDPNTTYDQYVYAVHHGVMIEQLAAFMDFPTVPTLEFIQFDDLSLGQYHEICASTVNEHNGWWVSTLQRPVISGTEFINLVLNSKTRCR